ncbi:hypothetical protein [Halorhabdus sp. SVX81]|uniref:hypothetical protein n=1 Tax=Halorhabdus sp. SVX81 TaxID=2978283 RepID=UPI0023D9A7E6|nr:hypothetical protein [Halorhabdus sp. SVX81]
MKRRTYLKGITASTSLLGLSGFGQTLGKSRKNTNNLEEIQVLKGTEDDPISSKAIQNANQKIRNGRKRNHSVRNNTKSAQSIKNNRRLVLPNPRIPDSRKTVSYMIGTTASGQVKYFCGTVPKGNHHSKAAKANHEKMDQYVTEVSSTDSFATNSVSSQSTCSDEGIPSMAQMDGSKQAVEGFGCPQIGGRRIDEGSSDGSDSYKDTMSEGEVTVEEKFYHDYLEGYDDETADQWCGALTAVRATPGSELTSSSANDEFVLGHCNTSHNWDQNAYMSPESGRDDQSNAIYGNNKNSGGTKISSVSISAGPKSFGFGIGWTPEDSKITTSIDSSRARWEVNYNNPRARTATHTWGSICQYEEKANSGDKVLTSRVDTEFQDFIGPFLISRGNSHTEVDYTFG